MRSDKNQRNLLVEQFPFFIRAMNNQVQLRGTKYYFRVGVWRFVKIDIKPSSSNMFSHYNKSYSFKNRFEDVTVIFEEVLDNSPVNIQEQLLFHLDLFR